MREEAHRLDLQREFLELLVVHEDRVHFRAGEIELLHCVVIGFRQFLLQRLVRFSATKCNRAASYSGIEEPPVKTGGRYKYVS